MYDLQKHRFFVLTGLCKTSFGHWVKATLLIFIYLYYFHTIFSHVCIYIVLLLIFFYEYLSIDCLNRLMYFNQRHILNKNFTFSHWHICICNQSLKVVLLKTIVCWAMFCFLIVRILVIVSEKVWWRRPLYHPLTKSPKLFSVQLVTRVSGARAGRAVHSLQFGIIVNHSKLVFLLRTFSWLRERVISPMLIQFIEFYCGDYFSSFTVWLCAVITINLWHLIRIIIIITLPV